MTSSPLLVLVEAFAVFAVILGAMILCTLGLAVRHRHRREKGVYSELFMSKFSTRVQQVITVGDLLADSSLRALVRARIIALNESSQAMSPFPVSTQRIVRGTTAQEEAIPLTTQAYGTREPAEDDAVQSPPEIPSGIRPSGSGQISRSAQAVEPGRSWDDSVHDTLRVRAWTGLITIVTSDVVIAVGAILGVIYVSRGSVSNSATVAILTVGFASIGTMTTAYLAITRVTDSIQSSSQRLDDKHGGAPPQEGMPK